MRSSYVMRYYHPFPEAIPLLKVGCSRVTHPSATNLKEQALSRPFDLHVLGVPPAFVLSQDQTLHRVVSPNQFYLILKSGSLRIARNYCLRFIVLSDFSKYNADFTIWIDQGFQFFLPFLFSHCSVFKMQFSSFLRGFVLVRRLIYYTTLSDFCQAFFKVFLKFFLDRGSGSFPVSLDQVVSLFIIPHFKLFVKRFFRFFQIFFSLTRPDSVIFLALCPALWLPSGLAANLFIIPRLRSFVKPFSKFLLNFSLDFTSQNLLRLFNFP